MKNKLVIFVILIILTAGIYLVSDSFASTTDILLGDEVINASEAKNPSPASAIITITWTGVSE